MRLRNGETWQGEEIIADEQRGMPKSTYIYSYF